MIQEIANYEAAEALVRTGIPTHAILLGDQAYALPTHDWVAINFGRFFSKVLEDLGIRWDEERQDCEDIARLCAWAATRCHAKTPGAPVAGLAFGELWCARREHALNFAIHQHANTLAVVVYEPQLDARGFSCRTVLFDPEDFQSVYHARL